MFRVGDIMNQKGIINFGSNGKKLLAVNYDRLARCAYFTFSENEIARTIQHVPDMINIDVDREGQLVGIEFIIGNGSLKVGLNSKTLDEISKVYHFPGVKDIPKVLHEELTA